jgi:hypothetical protein
VLEHPDVRAAREVRERGPWALTRAITLAEKVLAQAKTRSAESPSPTRSVSRRRRG